jgi:hypothetical protein
MRKQITVGLCLLIAGFAGGFWLSPKKIKIEERVVEKIVVKEVSHHDVKRNVDTETRIVKRPDGTTETVVHERDRSLETSETERDSTTDRSSHKSTSIERGSLSWIFTALVPINQVGLDYSKSTLVAERYIAFGVSMGPFYSLDTQSFGLGVSVQF